MVRDSRLLSAVVCGKGAKPYPACLHKSPEGIPGDFLAKDSKPDNWGINQVESPVNHKIQFTKHMRCRNPFFQDLVAEPRTPALLARVMAIAGLSALVRNLFVAMAPKKR